MPDKYHSDFANFAGQNYRFDIFTSDQIPQGKTITQVYGLVLNRDRTCLLAVLNENNNWSLPGGGIEPGEVPHQTLIREIKEETNCTVKSDSIKPLYYQDVYRQESTEWVYECTQLRMVAQIEVEGKFVSDPDGDISKVEWIKIEELGEYIHWGKSIAFIQKLLG